MLRIIGSNLPLSKFNAAFSEQLNGVAVLRCCGVAWFGWCYGDANSILMVIPRC